MSASFPSHHQKGHLLFLGDSLVAGYDWQKRMPRFIIRNCGVPGATTRDLLRSLSKVKARFDKAQLILVMIGTNDLVQENYAFIEDLKQVIITLNRLYPNSELLINSLLPIQIGHLSSNAIEKLNEHIRTICRDTGSCYIDLYSKFLSSDSSVFQQDGVHITDTGYEIWARTLLEHIAFLVEND